MGPAIIGGTGLDMTGMMTGCREVKVATGYGEVAVTIGSLAGTECAFIYRHGSGHTLPPHMVNYRANIAAMKKLGVTAILASASTGSMRHEYGPGSLIILDQFIDYTRSRAQTFSEGMTSVLHVDMTDPFCPGLRNRLMNIAAEENIPLHNGGTYVCTEGPRFETPAEIRAYALQGGDLVGMTLLPEVVLAREAGLCYAALAIVTNYAAGISPTPLTHAEVCQVMEKESAGVRRIFKRAVASLSASLDCDCNRYTYLPEECFQ